MQAELPNLDRRAIWSSIRIAIYSCSCPSTHLATSVFWNLSNSALSPVIRRDSISEVLACISWLATLTQAAKLLGRQVKVGGQVHLVLLPAPELRFDDIKVANQDGSFDKPFLESRSVEAWLNIGALLSGSIEARRIESGRFGFD